ncbi:fumarylacetoacetate hydrolase family protein [Sphingobium sp. MK2]|uniref:fumarylacetoacetate hydrolase family protein n=1 Tax=Sphingobium sp. MK2 TaxID=3116540 RepID=UPI0032E35B48
MQCVGVEWNGQRWIGRTEGDQIILLATAEAFFADPFAARSLPGTASIARSDAVIRPPAWHGARVICVGLNYRAHAAEGGFQAPDFPAIFGRWTRSLVEDGGDVPALEEKLDWEAELGVVIGRQMAGVKDAEALDGVFGYAAFNDITARTYQRHTHQWTTGKNMDRSGVLGAITTADEVGDPATGLHIESRLNGQVMQSANTADLIFPVGRIISYLSEIMTLFPGDIIASGTPEGVGHARKPPLFMKPGDVIEVEIEKVGLISNRIVPGSQRGV